MNKKLLTGNEIKSIELDILCKFNSFCKENNLKYFLAYGTLLGAIRHKGFIPWDDDIDVCMTREDYERFLNLSNDFTSMYNDISVIANKFSNYDAPFCKIYNTNTIIHEKEMNNIVTGLWIDIFPLDSLPDNIDERRNIFLLCNFYRKIWYWAGVKPWVGKNIFRKIIKSIVRPIAYLYGRNRCVENLMKQALKYEGMDSSYVANIVWGLANNRERLNKKWLDEIVYVEFEKKLFPSIAAYDEWLTNIYGDYMTLPPIDRRVNHNMTAYMYIEASIK